MIIIRLSRKGKKKLPFYKIIVTDKRNAKDKKCIEKIGFFNPFASNIKKKIYIKKNRLKKWLKNGAKISKRMKNIIYQYKNIYEKK